MRACVQGASGVVTSEQLLTALRRFVPDLSRDHGVHLLHSMHIEGCAAIDYIDFVAALTVLVEGEGAGVPMSALSAPPAPYPAPPPPAAYPVGTPTVQQQQQQQQYRQTVSRRDAYPQHMSEPAANGTRPVNATTGIFRVDVIPAAPDVGM